MTVVIVVALSLLAVTNGFSNHGYNFGTTRAATTIAKWSSRTSSQLDMALVSEFRPKKSSSSVMTEVETLTEDQVRGLFFLWNQALQTKDSHIVARRYSKGSVLLPIMSNVPCVDRVSIKEYYDKFLQKNPVGKVLQSKVVTGPNWAQDAGIYELIFGADGSRVMARYTFVYVFEDNKWRIAHHHSSYLPERVISTQKQITVAEVKVLFRLWNDALATLDSERVALRYSKKPCLLPTVSDDPRTDFEGIKSYYDVFLTRKPQGVIIDSNVYIGANWAQDAGVYEFTLGTTGQKFRARYTFIYILEDGEWKIQHHHSSVMPEGIPASAATINASEVRALFTLWNDALATLDAEIVANRFTMDAVLLPSISDTPRTSKALIKDHYAKFLERKPQAEIISGDITIGEDWAQDSGIYEFTMGDDGSRIRARYSFIYVPDNGHWKIAHHHSSFMPETDAPAVTKVVEPVQTKPLPKVVTEKVK
jgi:uncharacterized protein (TIGR02246 family)